jgi:hypothetical protein
MLSAENERGPNRKSTSRNVIPKVMAITATTDLCAELIFFRGSEASRHLRKEGFASVIRFKTVIPRQPVTQLPLPTKRVLPPLTECLT